MQVFLRMSSLGFHWFDLPSHMYNPLCYLPAFLVNMDPPLTEQSGLHFIMSLLGLQFSTDYIFLSEYFTHLQLMSILQQCLLSSSWLSKSTSPKYLRIMQRKCFVGLFQQGIISWWSHFKIKYVCKSVCKHIFLELLFSPKGYLIPQFLPA